MSRCSIARALSLQEHAWGDAYPGPLPASFNGAALRLPDLSWDQLALLFHAVFEDHGLGVRWVVESMDAHLHLGGGSGPAVYGNHGESRASGRGVREARNSYMYTK